MPAAHEEPEDIRALLVRQLSSPVRWTDTLRARGVPRPIAQVIECGPGKVLTALNRRIERARRAQLPRARGSGFAAGGAHGDAGKTPMLENEVALVTGASRGIGHAIALALGGAGARVIGTATTAEGAAKFGAELATLGYRGRGARLDAGEPASIDALMAELETAGESPTILVNNAAITRDTLLLRMKPEDWDAVITTNLTAVFRLSKACVRRMMKERRGRIVNLTSVVGVTGNAGQANYAAAKAGLHWLHQVPRQGTRLAQHHRECSGARVHRYRHDAGLNEEQRAALLAQIPMGRLGTPADVAAAVLFLASPQATYVTGETLHVNGGMFMP